MARLQNGFKSQPDRPNSMPSLTIKNIPQDLLERLRERATANRRSLNSEVLACLERELMPQVSEEDLMERLDALRDRLRERGVPEPTPEELEEWINWGRE